MIKYFLTETALVRADLAESSDIAGTAPPRRTGSRNASDTAGREEGIASSSRAGVLAILTVTEEKTSSERKVDGRADPTSAGPAAGLKKMKVRWDGAAPPVETVEAAFVVDESKVYSLSRDMPVWLLEKVKRDYGLPSWEASALVELYKFQAATYVIGLELAKARQLFSPEWLAKLASVPVAPERRIEDTVPLVASVLRREGIPYMRWWEEQAENFIDLWFSPFRLFDRPDAEEARENAASPESAAAKRGEVERSWGARPRCAPPSETFAPTENPSTAVPTAISPPENCEESDLAYPFTETGAAGATAPDSRNSALVARIAQLERRLEAVMSYLNMRE